MSNSQSISAIFDNAYDQALVVDEAANIIWCNSSARDLLGADIIGYNLDCVLSKKNLQWLSNLLGSGQTKLKLVTKNGDTVDRFVMTCDLSSPDPDGHKRLLVFSSVPPTGAPEREQFLALLSHDLKNPLGAIFGYTDVLLDTSNGQGLNTVQRDLISKIRSSAARAIDMIRNNQHLCQLEEKGLSMPLKPCTLNLALQSVIDYTWREDGKAAELKFQLAQNDILVAVPRMELERMLSNLFSNALKYTPSDGQITLRTWQAHNWAYFSVHNTAPIIEADELKTLFQRYQRGKAAGYTSGSGLGLYIVRYIAELVGGEATVTSNNEIGTTFTLKLPLA